jgi:hypothetical protein
VTHAIDPIAVALRVTEVLDRLGVPPTIGGSIAASFAGEPRATIDIDIVAALGEHQVEGLVSALSDDFYADAESLRRAVQTRGSANLIHRATQLKVDVFIAGGTPLDMQQLQRRLRVELGEGRTLYVHPPEDILLQKLRWYRQGGEVSDRQWRDILGIIRTQGSRLDRDYLASHDGTLGVHDFARPCPRAGLMDDSIPPEGAGHPCRTCNARAHRQSERARLSRSDGRCILHTSCVELRSTSPTNRRGCLNAVVGWAGRPSQS